MQKNVYVGSTPKGERKYVEGSVDSRMAGANEHYGYKE